MEEFTAFVGLDVHKDSIVPAVAEGGRGGRVEVLGRIPMEARALRRLVERLARRYRHLEFCYEAGPCGYGVYRLLEGLGHRCLVAAPSKLSRAPGDRVKNDKSDARLLAVSLRAGLVVPVWVPDQRHEAVRGLVRGRRAAVKARKSERQRLTSLLLVHGRCYAGKARWTRPHWAWLADQRFEDPALQLVKQDAIEAIRYNEERVKLLTTSDAGDGRRNWHPGAGGGGVAGAVRDQRGGRGDPDGGDRRSAALRLGVGGGGVSRAAAERGVERRPAATGFDHQGRQRRGAPRADRGGLVLPPAARRSARRSRGGARACRRRCGPRCGRRTTGSTGATGTCARWATSGRLVAVTAVARELAGVVWAVACWAMDPSRGLEAEEWLDAAGREIVPPGIADELGGARPPRRRRTRWRRKPSIPNRSIRRSSNRPASRPGPRPRPRSAPRR